MNSYKGIIRIKDNKALLDAGGIMVELDADPATFAPYNGCMVTINGNQQGDVVQQATLATTAELAPAGENGHTSLPAVITAIKTHPELAAIPGLVGLRPGFSENPDAPDLPVIVAVYHPGQKPETMPASIDHIKIEQRMATVQEQISGLLPLSVWEDTAAVAEAAAPAIAYTPPPEDRVKLEEMEVNNITCHVGPDSGWYTLKPFLEGTTERLTVAMYEFYAEHIIKTVTKLGEDTTAELNMILQVSTNDETIEETLRESWGDRLTFVRASVSGPNRIFNNSYHTKVAVRDSNAFWLSSGNWSPNSQPDVVPGADQFPYRKGNREWHVIIEDAPLAVMYEEFIRYDMEQAAQVGAPEAAPIMPDLLIPASFLEQEAGVIQPFPFEAQTFASSGTPVKVKPLMSPDNYAEELLTLIESATKSLYLQFSYIRQPSKEVFDHIIDAIAQKMKEGIDVRVLVSSNQNADHSDLLIAKRGWKRSMFRKQSAKMHNKGVLVDGKIAVVGSNNWSTDGTQYNRDTSLVFYSRPIAQYFTKVFLFDWDNLSSPIARQEEIQPVLAPESGPTPLGMIRIPWQAWFDE
ncbi:phospholipase D-like domain-containing protein [Chitinophaga pinensis]|uniref:phospholipase D n=1 Tax=Chitinophaga pinensis (strain ATCC 43595 / DSM 2588 / LMG 13176 / NBRC 15968 / NCIMB 11800 / UQM 2034) TaxID=485918 RepID=A0A979G554_CHIPD|nr:phospholipase D-like domain-containing protein [Chitinophaga pinensis]ACU60941.1 phospholipase D/Transphosphatidylase [Chitinophaga pinensis DSM 2588]